MNLLQSTAGLRIHSSEQAGITKRVLSLQSIAMCLQSMPKCNQEKMLLSISLDPWGLQGEVFTFALQTRNGSVIYVHVYTMYVGTHAVGHNLS